MNMRAIKVITQGMEIYPSPELERMLARQYYETGQYQKAKPLLYKHSDSNDLFFQLINILEYESKLTQAIVLMKDRLTSDSLNTNILSRLGTLYYQQNDNDSSIHCFNRALDINPLDQMTSNKLANLLLKNKHYDRAIVICDRMLAVDSTLVKFINIKALCHFKNNNFINAKYYYSLLIQSGDSSQQVLKNIGICEIKTEDFEESRKHLLKAFRNDSSDVEICFYLGKGFYNSMTPEVGLDFLNRSDSLLKPNPILLSMICLEKRAIHSIMGNHSQAIQCYEQAYQYNNDPKLKFYMADVYQHKLVKRQMAVKFYESFLTDINANNTIDIGLLSAEEQSLIMQARQNIKILREEMFFESELK